jgi:multisubunit Na+/H+ antiporter MnhE subunit
MLRSFGLPELIILAIILIIAVKALRSRSVRGVVLGAILGAIVGFLLRPSVPLVGQLPFPVVITRGANLSGLDIILRSVAEQSFNYMMVGAIVGAIVLAAWVSMTRKPSPTAATAAATTVPPTPSNAASGSPGGKFCTRCGAALGSDIVFCGACGTRRS